MRIWSRSKSKLLCVSRTTLDSKNSETPRDKATGDFSDSVKGRALAVSPEGDFIVAGFKDGTLRQFSVSGSEDDIQLS